MSNPLIDKVEIARRTMVLFFLVDASGSMEGSKIGSVNAAIEDVIPDIKKMDDGNADAQIKIAVMKFSIGAHWLTESGPVEAGQYHWQTIDAAGVTDLGAACRELNKKLSRKEFMQDATGSFAPAIFLLSDGDPTDDFEGGLAELKQNNWFKAAIKVAVAIGEDADKEMLAKFTGTKESVLEVHSAAMLKKMIQFVSVTASQVASKSSNISADPGAGEPGIEDTQKQQDLNDALVDFQQTQVDDGIDW
jgi:uncharacterized protein YegL